MSGINWTNLTLHTIAHLKGYSCGLNCKKLVSAFSAKNGGVCFEVAYSTKTLVPRLYMLPQPKFSYATCHLGIRTHRGRIQSKILFNYFFLFISPLPPAASSGMPPVSSDEEAAVSCRSTPSAFLTHVNMYLFSTCKKTTVAQWISWALTFWHRKPPQNRCPLFLALNAETGFCNLQHDISPLSVPKKHWRLYANS